MTDRLLRTKNTIDGAALQFYSTSQNLSRANAAFESAMARLLRQSQRLGLEGAYGFQRKVRTLLTVVGGILRLVPHVAKQLHKATYGNAATHVALLRTKLPHVGAQSGYRCLATRNVRSFNPQLNRRHCGNGAQFPVHKCTSHSCDNTNPDVIL